ncbi:exodeoxyribonuclease V subunit alpha [Thiorhodococcus fuscus]|uniref:RecBCD enzyme subunit RecD n=1 Tax=Thiorhodococcus fuscus TaxID=527200 RepID=A0ABW4YC97_9GAMM
MTAEELFVRLETWVETGVLRALDLALARFIHVQCGETDPAVLLAVALTSERNAHGHVCLDLEDTRRNPDALLARLRNDGDKAEEVRRDLPGLLAPLRIADWITRLSRSPAIDSKLVPPAATEATDGEDQSPLVLHGTPERPLLYLRRYWRDEQRICAGIQHRLEDTIALPEENVRGLLDRLFAPTLGSGSDAQVDAWQKVACALAARNAFAVITGGPGTGKTTTVVRLLALLQGLAMGRGEAPLRIRLAAPTGKAAARLNASIAGQVADLPLDAIAEGERIRAEIPTQVTTLHRLLGPIPNSRHFRHHAGNPLPADLVVVDEASMIDVEMMARLLDALRPEVRLILLGDKDQLASVEAGAVLGDLCQRAREAHYRPQTAEWLQGVTGQPIPSIHLDPEGRPLDQAIAMLRRSYRFKPEGGIGALAELVNAGMLDHRPVTDRLAALKSLFERQQSDMDAQLGRIAAIRLRDTQDTAFDDLIRDGYAGYLRLMRDGRPDDQADRQALDDWASAVLDAHAGFQLLTALREGPWGVEGLNRRIIEVLSTGDEPLLQPRTNPAQTFANASEGWFAGRPLLVTRNDYGLRLMNGDIGIALEVPVRQADGAIRRVLRVAFPSGDGTGGIRWILPSRLTAIETVFAMTVHKSQGSEFIHTALILPDTPNPVLTRELVYTGITRARKTFTLLYSQDHVLADALSRRVERVSGLALSLDGTRNGIATVP